MTFFVRLTFTSMTKFLIVITISILLSAYLERFQVPYLIDLKEAIYGAQKKTEYSGELIKTKNYNGEGGFYLNPVNNAQLYLADAECLIGIAKHNYTSCDDLATYRSAVSMDGLAPHRVAQLTDLFIKEFTVENIDGLSVVRFPYEVGLKAYGGLPSPWYSGMASGHVLILSLASFEITGDPSYLEYADYIFNGYQIGVSSGGFRVPTARGTLFEEYASPVRHLTRSPTVLNGHIFAMDGLYWYTQYQPDNEVARELLLSSLRFLNGNISKFSSHFWSFYDLYTLTYADLGYHSIHVKQLSKVLSLYKQSIEFDSSNIEYYQKKFDHARLLPFGFIERLIFQRNRMIVVTFVLNLCIALFLFIMYRYLLVRVFKH